MAISEIFREEMNMKAAKHKIQCDHCQKRFIFLSFILNSLSKSYFYLNLRRA